MVDDGSPRIAVVPDRDGRVDGTTYPAAVAPDGAVPLWIDPEFGSAQVLRPRPGDVLVVRTDNVAMAQSHGLEQLGLELRRAGVAAIVVLPRDCLVHLEPQKLHREDRGYRETAVYGADKPQDNRDGRGVHTGVPGLPDGPLPPHPESESGGDDPCGG